MSPAAGAGREIPGPPAWSAADQAALFTRFGFSFLNAPLMAGTAALLVPLAVGLGSDRRVAVLLAMAFGLGTLAWPYAKHDFAEPAAGSSPWRRRPWCSPAPRRRHRGRRWPILLVGAGILAALASGSKYTAAWFIPLLGVQIALLWRRRAPAPLAAFLGLPVLALAGMLLFTGRAPALWSGLAPGPGQRLAGLLALGGLYGLLLSPGKSLFLYAPPLLLAVVGLPLFCADTVRRPSSLWPRPWSICWCTAARGSGTAGGGGHATLCRRCPLLRCGPCR
jgi:hypothetical protein